MCGISGYINIDGRLIRSSSTNRKMLLAQKHRGPDDAGICAFSLRNRNMVELSVTENQVIDEGYEGIIGFNRLSILDISPNGHQPMISNDGNVILTLNGEIYNAFDYKKELEDWGYCFRGTSDTEIVLAMYLKYGLSKMLEHLNGMYAIVIIDLRIASLYVIRDRFGIKPMYYIYQDNFLAFSSEFKSFKYLDNFEFKLNSDNLDEYLLFRYNVQGTLIKDIEVIEPGCYLELNSDNNLKTNKYFDVNKYSRKNITELRTEEQYKQQLLNILVKSVKYQLISDVKVGCQLSGGVDSSLITYLANRIDENKSFESISIVFEDRRFSEEEYIDQVVDKINIESHKINMDSNYFFENIEKTIWHFEAPLSIPNAIGIYLLASNARNYLTVLLSGEGADEILGGYGRFNYIRYPYNIRAMGGYLKYNFPYSLFLSYFSSSNRAILSSDFIRLNMANLIMPVFNIGKAMSSRREIYRELSGSVFDRQVKYEMKTYLPELLTRQDKMSMAHSIENRVPFLDHDIVDTIFKIPEHYLINRTSGKYLLKKIVQDIFGSNFAFRHKSGFSLPLKNIFMNNKMNQYLRDIILPEISDSHVFNSKIIEKWINNISALSYFELEALWTVSTFGIWKRLYLN